jgi:hypothetical protein
MAETVIVTRVDFIYLKQKSQNRLGTLWSVTMAETVIVTVTRVNFVITMIVKSVDFYL